MSSGQAGDRPEPAELFRLLVESAEGYAIITTDLERRVTTWNRGAQRLMGWSEEEIRGQSADMIFTPEDREKGDPAKEASKAVAEGRAENKRWHMRKDESRFWGDGLLCPLKDGAGRTQGLAKVFRDRTAEVQAAEAREQAERRKDEFLAILCHELRNPLAAISNSVQVLLLAEASESAARRLKEIIARQVKNLAVIVDDLLDISRLNRDKVQLRKEPLDVGPIIARAVEAVSHLIEEKNHEVHVSVVAGHTRVNADPTRLEQIIVNLLTNAAKFTEPKGRLRVAAHSEPGSVIIQVSDNGIGILPETIQHVFELFAQADKSLERTHGGLGIGLAVVRKLVELHGGSITATSSGLGQGSQFTVRLPTQEEDTRAEPAATERRPDEQAAHPLRILVVEDRVDIASGMATLLQREGHGVQIAHDGHTAVELARALRPDVLLVDLGLPGLSGYEVTARLRGEACCRESVFIAISGYAQEQDRERSRAAGFDHHLAKPVDLGKVRALLSQRVWRAPGASADEATRMDQNST
jgi:two-component system CheB/CheR fusion protein